MAASTLRIVNSIFALVLHLLILSAFFSTPSLGARKLSSLYIPPPVTLSYHHGPLLQARLPVSILWYGTFSPAQKAIVSDFFLSLDPHRRESVPVSGLSLHPRPDAASPLVSTWWGTVETYLKTAGKPAVQVVLTGQISDKDCSLGKLLKRSQLSELAGKAVSSSEPGGVAVVLTAEDVAVEGFCMSSCGFHGSDEEKKWAFIWVGNSASQCPGQCAWPFHQPIYGPQSPALGAPNGDVGVDGMVVNIAGLLANSVTNPFGNGYYEGSAEAPMEAASACSGVYGKGAYPGYAGELLVDSGSGGSYNAVGVNGRKYLLPALFDPLRGKCWTLV
ncbi:hypothetical protein Dimus_006129 [Dionaea muscipula]